MALYDDSQYFVTILAAAFAFTPIFDWVGRGLLNIPENIQSAAKPGMAIMILWSGLIGYRRFIKVS